MDPLTLTLIFEFFNFRSLIATYKINFELPILNSFKIEVFINSLFIPSSFCVIFILYLINMLT
jgi:hypothetical protein